ncbi:phytohormone-binding protein-like protein [Tanacetum coccineum]
MKEDTAQLKVAIPIKVLWKAMSIDIRHITPKILPNIVSEVELREGDGGYGSILLFKFCPVDGSSNCCLFVDWPCLSVLVSCVPVALAFAAGVGFSSVVVGNGGGVPVLV